MLIPPPTSRLAVIAVLDCEAGLAVGGKMRAEDVVRRRDFHGPRAALSVEKSRARSR